MTGTHHTLTTAQPDAVRLVRALGEAGVGGGRSVCVCVCVCVCDCV